MNDLKLSELDLVENPTARVPVCLCLDVSQSMQGQAIEELNMGIKEFYNAINSDEVAKYSAEICIVTFGEDVEVKLDFASIERQEIPTLKANGLTPMGEAVNLSLDLLENRKKEYSDKGVDYYQPWLIIMTDGAPNGDSEELKRSIDRTVQMVENRKLTLFPIGIGPNADMKVLSKYSPNRRPLKLKDLNFVEFFQWLSNSVSRVSMSMPGEKVELDVSSLQDWATL